MDLKRNSVIALHLEGKSNIEIIRALNHMNLSKMFVYRTIKRFTETGSIKKRYGGGRRCTATSRENVNKVRKRLHRNPERSSQKIANDLNISDRSVRRIMKNKLKVKPLKKQKCQELTDAKKKVRLERSKAILRMAARGDLPNLVFSDEKTFCIEQFLNKQNDRVWLKRRSDDNYDHLRVTRKQGAAQIMVLINSG